MKAHFPLELNSLDKCRKVLEAALPQLLRVDALLSRIRRHDTLMYKGDRVSARLLLIHVRGDPPAKAHCNVHICQPPGPNSYYNQNCLICMTPGCKGEEDDPDYWKRMIRELREP